MEENIMSQAIPHHQPENPTTSHAPQSTSHTPSPTPYNPQPTTYDDTTLLAWTGPGRPWKKRTKTYYMTSILILLFVEIILFLFSQYILMLTVISFVFLAFALASVEPHDFHYRITREGILVEDHFYIWEELYDFYFKKRFGEDVLLVRTRAFLPGILTITLKDMPKEEVKNALIRFLPFREYVKPTFMEKAGDWISEAFPLEKTATN